MIKFSGKMIIVLAALIVAVGFSVLAYQYVTLEANYQILLEMSQQQQTVLPHEDEVLAAAQQVKAGVVGVFLRDVPEGAPIAELSDGTGFIIHENGYILTNRHVVEGETNIKIVAIDGKVYDAQLVAMSSEYPSIDIALLKAPIEAPTVLEFGDTQEMRRGDVVFSVGHPSAWGTWVTLAGEFEYCWRTYTPRRKLYGDSYIYKPSGTGESGSPLFDLESRVIGIVHGTTAVEKGERIGPDNQILVWLGSAGLYWGNYTLAFDTDTIYEFIEEELGEALAAEIFGPR